MSTAIRGVATAPSTKGKSTSPGQCGGASCCARSRHGPGGTTPPRTLSNASRGNGYRAPFSTSSSASISPQAMFSTETVRLCFTQNACAARRGSSWRLARSSCILPFTSTSTTNSGAARAQATMRRPARIAAAGVCRGLPPLCWLVAVLPAAGRDVRTPCGSMRSLYVSKPGVASSLSWRAAPLPSSQPAQEALAALDGVSDAGADFVRDVSDGSRPV